MKLKGVVLRTLEEQIEGGDTNPINPSFIDHEVTTPVTIGFDSFEQAAPIVGKAKLHVEDGRLIAEITLDSELDLIKDDLTKLAIGVTARAPFVFGVALTKDNQDTGISDFIVES